MEVPHWLRVTGLVVGGFVGLQLTGLFVTVATRDAFTNEARLLALALFFAVPLLVLWWVASAQSQSRTHILWALLGLGGLAIGLLHMLTKPPTPEYAPTLSPADGLRELIWLHDEGASSDEEFEERRAILLELL